MRNQWIAGGALALLIAVSWTLSAAGQTGITVTGAKTVYEPSYSSPDSLLQTALEQVAERIKLTYAAALKEYIIPGMDPDLQARLVEVTDRIIMGNASGSRHYGLIFPAELVNDQVAPTLSEPVTTFVNSSDTVNLSWSTEEFTTSTLEYGTVAGSYNEVVDITEFITGTTITVPNLVSGTTYYARITMVDLSGNQGQSEEFTFAASAPAATPTAMPTAAPPSITESKPLVLIYAVLDNNLGDDIDDWLRLVQNVERGANSTINVRLLIDSPGNNNAYVYEVAPDVAPCITLANPTCSGRYVENNNFWRVDEDTAHPMSLYEFASNAIAAHGDASKIILSMVGHGSGWSAGSLPSQPSSWEDQPSRSGSYQERIGGLLWDDTLSNNTDGSRSMSTKALGVAFEWIQAETGRPIDLLYLDACSMGMAEIAYEIANNVGYLLASPNTAWASFPYERLLKATKAEDSAEAIGLAWLNVEKETLDARSPSYPYTLSLYNLSNMDALASAVNMLVSNLNNALPTQRTVIEQAVTALERYESDYDGSILNGTDSYGDLWSFLQMLQPNVVADQALSTAITAVQTAIGNVIVGQSAFGEGRPYLYPAQEWNWANSRGLGIYFPNGNDPKQDLYIPENLGWLQTSNWHQFLDNLQTVTVAQVLELPTCESTRGCDSLPIQLPLQEEAIGAIYLPFVTR